MSFSATVSHIHRPMKTLTDLVTTDILETLPLIGLYAEAHFRFLIPISRYFQRQPELIFDTPWRLEPGQPLILFLVVKDADEYPVHLHRANFSLSLHGKPLDTQAFQLDRLVDLKMSHLKFILDTQDLPRGELMISPSLEYSIGKRSYTMQTDNYIGTPKPPLRVTLSQEALPVPKGWLAGDLHLHSALTTDQIEFGAPLDQTREAARSFGLDFITATDHSYDLDDKPENYLENDPALAKWAQSRRQIAEINTSSGPTIIPGEEISVANARGATVHFLHYDDNTFFAGNADSGDTWPKMRSEHTIDDVLEKRTPGTVSVAAHTAYKFPWWQRFLLKRGWWEAADHTNPAMDGVQILCGTPAYEAFHQSRSLWIDALLNGRRLAVYGGSDGHGNFNRNWHIKIPLWSMGIHEDQIFAQVLTLLKSPSANVEDLMEAMRKKRTALTTGPVGDLRVRHGDVTYGIGSEVRVKRGTELKLEYSAQSSSEFGENTDITFYSGNLESKEELMIDHIQGAARDLQGSHPFIPLQPGYVRMEISSEGSRWPGVYISTPVWIDFS